MGTLLDAERFVSRPRPRRAWSVPSEARTFIAPAEMPSQLYFQKFKERTGSFLAMPGSGVRMLRFPNLPVPSLILRMSALT